MPDILDVIDAATGARCACGCGAALDPGGPSAWFAGPACQSRYHARLAENPADVYLRPDAAPVFVEADHLAVPINEPPVMGSLLHSMLSGARPYDDRPRVHTFTVPDAEAVVGAPTMTIAFDDTAIRAACEAVVEQVRRTVDVWAVALMPAMHQAGAAVADLARHVRPLLPEEPPADPMQRALWFRRNRNTGPAPRPRAPRRIDPRRAR